MQQMTPAETMPELNATAERVRRGAWERVPVSTLR